MMPHPIPSSLADNCSFFDEVERIADPNYIPVESDVLRARTKTTGIYETRFTMGQLSIQCVRILKQSSGAPANLKQHV
jgi:guanine nucleotide-binding protein subunit alpha